MDNKNLNLMEYGVLVTLVVILVFVIYLVLDGELSELLAIIFQ